MLYLELLNKLAKLEKIYQDKNILSYLKEPPEMEELPLMIRDDRVELFANAVRKEDLDSFFLNTAVFYLNNIRLMAKMHLTQQEYDNLFFCINYNSLEYIDIYDFYVPSLCIGKKKYEQSIKNNPVANLDNYVWLTNALNNLHYTNKFNLVYSQFTDQSGDEIFRIFLLDKE